MRLKIWCDGESWKILGFGVEVNKASIYDERHNFHQTIDVLKLKFNWHFHWYVLITIVGVHLSLLKVLTSCTLSTLREKKYFLAICWVSVLPLWSSWKGKCSEYNHLNITISEHAGELCITYVKKEIGVWETPKQQRKHHNTTWHA
jgi:hypothetical protein